MNRKNISYHKEGGWLGYTATYTIHFASILPILAYKHNIQLIPKYLHICSVWTSYISSSPNLKWYYVNMSLQLPPANITTMWYGGTGTYLWRYCRCHHNKIFYFLTLIETQIFWYSCETEASHLTFRDTSDRAKNLTFSKTFLEAHKIKFDSCNFLKIIKVINFLLAKLKTITKCFISVSFLILGHEAIQVAIIKNKFVLLLASTLHYWNKYFIYFPSECEFQFEDKRLPISCHASLLSQTPLNAGKYLILKADWWKGEAYLESRSSHWTHPQHLSKDQIICCL